MKTAPTLFESTTVICAYGMDLFCTRKMPSKGFDILGDDFSRAGLVTVIAALVGGIFVSRHMVRSKKLRQEWQ